MSMTLSVYREALKLLEKGDSAVMVTVARTQGSTPQKAGAKLLLNREGPVMGTLGGGCVEGDLWSAAMEVLEKGSGPELRRYDLNETFPSPHGMVCGGTMWFLIEPMNPGEHLSYLREKIEEARLSLPLLVVMGGGHMAQALEPLAKMLGFRFGVVDDREAFANRDRFLQADEVYVAGFSGGLGKFGLKEGDAVVVATRGHRYDDVALEAALQTPARYIGLLSSKRKALLLYRSLLGRGVSPERLGQVHTPVGLDIGARTPEEIAVSIMAEVLMVRNGRQGQMLKTDLLVSLS
jgi:xanthine dehydrogenase accessory factor